MTRVLTQKAPSTKGPIMRRLFTRKYTIILLPNQVFQLTKHRLLMCLEIYILVTYQVYFLMALKVKIKK